jgi:hypothetical protein
MKKNTAKMLQAFLHAAEEIDLLWLARPGSRYTTELVELARYELVWRRELCS